MGFRLWIPSILVELITFCYSKFASFKLYISSKEFGLQSIKFTRILVSICSYAPADLILDLYSTGLVIGLDIVNICSFRLVSHVAPKVL